MKTLLFDIDGTLIATNDAGTHALSRAMRVAFDITVPNMDVKFGGRTDSSLFRELLSLNGLQPSHDNFETLCKAYKTQLPASLACCGGTILPGVPDLLEKLTMQDGVTCCVMTGNLHATATMKLEHFGLSDYFEQIFGGDFDEDRRHLARRARLFLHGKHAQGSNDATRQQRTIVVIGDTPADINCALDINAICLAVCTGHFSHQSLELAGAHAVFENLNDVTQVVDWLLRQ